MAKGTRNFKSAMGLAALVLTGGATEAADHNGSTIVLRVANHAGAGPAELAQAQAHVDRVFEAIGVRVAWLESAAGSGDLACDGVDLLVTLLSTDRVVRVSKDPVRENIAGWASKAAARAFIYPDRIRELAARTRRSPGVLLGRVIAHEMGHLLLPPGHSPTGIMAEGMNNKPTSMWAKFTSDQAREIRAVLAAKAVNPDERRNCGN